MEWGREGQTDNSKYRELFLVASSVYKLIWKKLELNIKVNSWYFKQKNVEF